MSQPQAVIIAGPNGAGKSTVKPGIVPVDVPFVNADDIAREMGGDATVARDLAAGRVLVQTIRRLVSERSHFAVETNLANRTLALRIPEWQEAGYRVSLFFVWVASADLCVSRVAHRVKAGGHNIPEPVIRRRYVAGLHNFFTVYQPLVDTWRMYDNTDETGPRLVARGVQSVKDKILWQTMRRSAQNNTEEP